MANAIIVWIFYPETGGQPLEAVDTLFIDRSKRRRDSTLAIDSEEVDTDKKGVLDRFQWSIVRKADRQVNAYKRTGRRRFSETTLSGDTMEEEARRKAGDEQHEVFNK